jgi:hypothetical protein
LARRENLGLKEFVVRVCLLLPADVNEPPFVGAVDEGAGGI